MPSKRVFLEALWPLCSTLSSWIGDFVFWCHEQVIKWPPITLDLAWLKFLVALLGFHHHYFLTMSSFFAAPCSNCGKTVSKASRNWNFSALNSWLYKNNGFYLVEVAKCFKLLWTLFTIIEIPLFAELNPVG